MLLKYCFNVLNNGFLICIFIFGSVMHCTFRIQYILHFERNKHCYKKAIYIVDWIEFYAVSAIFQPCNGGDYYLNVISFEILKSLTSLLFIEFQSSRPFACQGVVILDTGHHLTSHPTDVGNCKSVKIFKFC